MKRRTVKTISILLIIALGFSGTTWARVTGEVNRMMVRSYDLLVEGKLDQAQRIYEKVLQRDPGNPLALNNLGAIMVKQKKYREALTYLEQALVRAKDYRVRVNQVCEVDGACLAFRPITAAYGDQDLTPLIKLNIELVKTRLAGPR